MKEQIILEGVACESVCGNFLFAPDDPVPGRAVPMRRWGWLQRMSDGTFEAIPYQWKRANSTLIRKLAHGRASLTQDGDIRLTLTVSPREGVNISKTILEEAIQASDAIRDFQLRR